MTEHSDGLRAALLNRRAIHGQNCRATTPIDDRCTCDLTPALASDAGSVDWDEFACDGQKCDCHDPFMCPRCGCLQNEAAASDVGSVGAPLAGRA